MVSGGNTQRCSREQATDNLLWWVWCVPIRLYLQKHGTSWIWPPSNSWPTASIMHSAIDLLSYKNHLAFGMNWWVSLVAQTVKNLPTMQETWLWFLGGEGPLEKGMATHSSILAWRIPWTERAWWATVPGIAKHGHNWGSRAFTFSQILSSFSFWF